MGLGLVISDYHGHGESLLWPYNPQNHTSSEMRPLDHYTVLAKKIGLESWANLTPHDVVAQMARLNKQVYHTDTSGKIYRLEGYNPDARFDNWHHAGVEFPVSEQGRPNVRSEWLKNEIHWKALKQLRQAEVTMLLDTMEMALGIENTSMDLHYGKRIDAEGNTRVLEQLRKSGHFMDGMDWATRTEAEYLLGLLKVPGLTAYVTPTSGWVDLDPNPFHGRQPYEDLWNAVALGDGYTSLTFFNYDPPEKT